MSTASSKRPTHRVFAVARKGIDRSIWSEIGAAWPHKDGLGFNLKLTNIPIGGAEIVLRNLDALDVNAASMEEQG